MRNLLIITQKVDENDDLLGFFVDWIEEFKKHIPSVKVIALNSPKKSWIRLFLRMLWYVPQSDAVFAHMSPIFVVIAGPWAWLWRKPVYLWYLHRSNTWRLRLAEKFVKKIFTASRASLTIMSKKIVEIGHGINANRFKTENRKWGNRILAVGRISPIKNYETLLQTGLPVTIVGRPVMPDDFAYFEKLKQYKNATFAGFVPYIDMPKYYADADIVVNCSPTGGIDKTALEAMAAGCLVLVANRAFKPYLFDDRLLFEYGNSEDLAKKIKELMMLPINEKRQLSVKLVESIRQFHSLDRTIQRITLML